MSLPRGSAPVRRHGVQSAGFVLVLATALVPAVASAQGVRVVPSLTVSETLTDNRDTASRDKRGDLITQVSPGLSLASREGALQGSLSYHLNGVAYQRDSSLNNVYHSLASAGSLSLLEGRAGVQASASAGRQVVSAFGVQSSDAQLHTGNQAQTYSYSLSPYLRGRLLGEMGYDIRLGYSWSASDAAELGDSRSLNVSAGLNGRRGALGWALNTSRSIAETGGNARRTHSGRVGGSLDYTADVEWRFSLNLGSEVDDLRTGLRERTSNWGYGVTWLPTPRTTAQFSRERRFFGSSHSFSLSHRMASTIWSASDSRSIDYGGVAGRGTVSLYDQLFAQLASREPDPVRRDALVRALIATGALGPEQTVVGGFLSGNPTVQRRQSVSGAYQGLRLTMALSAYRTWTDPIGTASSTGGGAGSNGQVRQQGWSLGLTQRLTPEATLTLAAGSQRTLDQGALGGNDLRTVTLTWSSRLGPYASATLGLRHSSFDSDTQPYQESAVIGSIRLQF